MESDFVCLQVLAGYLYHCAKSLGIISIEQCWQVRLILLDFYAELVVESI